MKVLYVISIFSTRTKIVDSIVIAMLCIQELSNVFSFITIECFEVGSWPCHDDQTISNVDEIQIVAKLWVDISSLWSRDDPSHKVWHRYDERDAVMQIARSILVARMSKWRSTSSSWQSDMAFICCPISVQDGSSPFLHSIAMITLLIPLAFSRSWQAGGVGRMSDDERNEERAVHSSESSGEIK